MSPEPGRRGPKEPGVIARYFDHLPAGPNTPVISLGEGSTPLLFSERLSQETDARVYLKYEGLNPTGSFKDRGMTVAISKACEERSKAVVCASTGNTSASAAAYAARAGLTCGVLIPRGNVAMGKLAQALIHGARVVEIDGNFDHALTITRALAARHPVELVNSVNPHRIEGQKTAAFEIVEDLGGAPDIHCIPVGNAGNITAYWRGYREARALGWSNSLPAMFGFQAEGASPIVRGEPVPHPETAATAIRIGNPASWEGAVEATAASGGAVLAVSEEQIAAAYRALAAEGIFVELASAASVAGLLELARSGRLARGAAAVCVLTGHGLKDPASAISSGASPETVPASPEAVAEALGLE